MLQKKVLLKFCFQIWGKGVFGCWKDAIIHKFFPNKAVWVDTTTPKWHFMPQWKAAMLTQAGSWALPVTSTGLCGHSCECRERRQQLLGLLNRGRRWLWGSCPLPRDSTHSTLLTKGHALQHPLNKQHHSCFASLRGRRVRKDQKITSCCSFPGDFLIKWFMGQE